MVRYLKYKDEELPVKLGYYALKMLQQEKKAGLEDLAVKISLYEPLLFYALKMGAKMEGIDFKWKIGQMADILEDNFMTFINMIPEFFPSEEEVKKPEEEGRKTKET